MQKRLESIGGSLKENGFNINPYKAGKNLVDSKGYRSLNVD